MVEQRVSQGRISEQSTAMKKKSERLEEIITIIKKHASFHYLLQAQKILILAIAAHNKNKYQKHFRKKKSKNIQIMNFLHTEHRFYNIMSRMCRQEETQHILNFTVSGYFFELAKNFILPLKRYFIVDFKINIPRTAIQKGVIVFKNHADISS